MRDLNNLNSYRLKLMGILGDNTCGKFLIPDPKGKFMYRVIASSFEEWDHVSVSLASFQETMIERCPKWDEMCYIKDLFFDESECVIQYHPAKENYVNIHPYVLHLWKPNINYPKPPTWMV